MQGNKNFEPRLFYQISLEQIVPKDHMVRRLAGLLDFGKIGSKFIDCHIRVVIIS